MGGVGVERDQILDPLKIKYQISDPPKKKSSIRYHTHTNIRYLALKNQISDPPKNQLSDITPPKKSNIRYQGTPVPPPPPPPIMHIYLNSDILKQQFVVFRSRSWGPVSDENKRKQEHPKGTIVVQQGIHQYGLNSLPCNCLDAPSIITHVYDIF